MHKAEAMMIFLRFRLYNKKIGLTRTYKFRESVHLSQNKTSCNSRIYPIRVRVRGNRILAEFPRHWR
jgi:hypothetical protein